MPKRIYTHTPRCAHPGCPESARYEYDRRADYLRGVSGHAGWKCTRHSQSGSVVGEENRVIETRLVCEQLPYGRFWQPIGNGFAHGPGFKAFAKDFEPGTVLVVTARLESAHPTPEAKP